MDSMFVLLGLYDVLRAGQVIRGVTLEGGDKQKERWLITGILYITTVGASMDVWAHLRNQHYMS